MELQEVVNVLGKLQKEVGLSYIIFEFDLSNGQILRTWWQNDIAKENEVQEKTDTRVFGSPYLLFLKYEVM